MPDMQKSFVKNISFSLVSYKNRLILQNISRVLADFLSYIADASSREHFVDSMFSISFLAQNNVHLFDLFLKTVFKF